MYNDSSRRHLYRARDGWIFGVSKGLADYADISVFWLRVILIALLFFTGVFPIVIVYLIAALLMKPEPVLEPRTEDDLEFYNSYVNSKSLALSRLKRRFEQLERRTRRMESIVTAKEFAWDQRLHAED